jgi:hypothetical protein
MNGPAPGWHPDPTRRHHYRYWDGAQWTDDVADGGVTSTDPIGGPTADAEATRPTDPTAMMDPTARVDPTQEQAPPGGAHQAPAGPGRKRPSGAVLAAIAVVVVALVGGIVYAVTRDGDDDSGDDSTEVADEDPTTTDPDDDTSDPTEGDDSGTDDTVPDDVDGGDRDELVEFMADNMEQASGGVLTHDEAVCISEGMLDELGVAGLVDIGESQENPFNDPELASQLAGIMEDCGISLEDLVTPGSS